MSTNLFLLIIFILEILYYVKIRIMSLSLLIWVKGIMGQSYIMSYYNKNFVDEKLPSSPELFYLQEFHQNQYNIDYLIMYKDKKEHSLSIDLDIFWGSYKFKLFGGNYLLNPLWNKLVFLRNDFSYEGDFLHKRILQGIYVSFWNYQNFFSYGTFYLEDFSKGIFLYNQNSIFLYDFYNKKYILFNKLLYKNLYSFINLSGEKKNIYGYSIVDWNIDNHHIGFFVVRKNYWDQYDFFTDSYREKYTSSSFYTNFNYKNKYINNNLNYFYKGNIIFLKIQSDMIVYNNDKFSILAGVNYLEKKLQKEIKNDYRYNINLLISHDLNYSFDIEGNKETLIFKFKVGMKRKYNFYLGLFYQHYNINLIQKHFDFFDVAIDPYYNQNYLIERTYLGILLESLIKLKKIQFYCNYNYQIKFIQFNKKEVHFIDIKFLAKF